jgi:hypothetical protein
MGSQGTAGKGGNVLPNSAPVTVQTTAGMVRALLAALRLGQPVTGPAPEINGLILALQQALVVAPSGPRAGGSAAGGRGVGPGGSGTTRPGP